jgi:hypothetical protein
MRISPSSTPPSAFKTTSSSSDSASVKVHLIQASHQAGVQAALAGRPSRPSPLQSRQANITSIANLSRQLGIDLPGRAVQLRPAMPAPSR